MIIVKTYNNDWVTLALDGKLDTVTCVQLSDELDVVFAEGKFNIILNMKGLDYVSSAGLRVLLAAQKKLAERDLKLVLTGINETVKEVFSITGFNGIFTIK